MRYPRYGGFRYRLASFFMGRNGTDTLFYVAFALSFVCIFLCGLFADRPVLYALFFFLYLALAGYGIFRMFSRNLARRRRENAAFRHGIAVLFTPLRRLRLRIRDRKTHVFRRCTACRSMLRLPRVPGEHTVRCPRCHESFSVKIKK